MNRGVAILLLGCVLISAVCAADDDAVLHPRGATSSANAPVVGRASGPGVPLLPIAVLCAVAGGWLYWRHRKNPAGAGARSERRLVIAETRPLGNRQHLVVADYEGRKFLLGVCPGRIDLLSRLDDPSDDSST